MLLRVIVAAALCAFAAARVAVPLNAGNLQDGVFYTGYRGATTVQQPPYSPGNSKVCEGGYVLASDGKCQQCLPGYYALHAELDTSRSCDGKFGTLCPISEFYQCSTGAVLGTYPWRRNGNMCEPPQEFSDRLQPGSCAATAFEPNTETTADLVSWSIDCTKKSQASEWSVYVDFTSGQCPVSTLVSNCGKPNVTVPWSHTSSGDCVVPSNSDAQGNCNAQSSFSGYTQEMKDAWARGCSKIIDSTSLVSARVYWDCGAKGGGICQPSQPGRFQPFYGMQGQDFPCASASGTASTTCECPSDKPYFSFNSVWQNETWTAEGCVLTCPGANTFANSTAEACQLCNFYNTTQASLKFESQPGSTTCSGIPQDQSYGWILNKKVECERDKYYNFTLSQCDYCPLGSLAAPLSTQCLTCGPGQITSYFTNQTCVKLNEESAAAGGNNQRYGSCQVLNSHCTDCGYGRINNVNHTECVDCNQQFYQPYLRSNSCIPCSSGYSGVGWKTCEACPMWHQFNGQECAPIGCSANQYYSTVQGETCKPCKENYYLEADVLELTGTRPTSCKPCVGGYQRLSGQIVCSPCPPGSAARNGTLAGQGCKLCEGPFYSPREGLTECHLCHLDEAIGSQQSSGSTNTGNTMCSNVTYILEKGPRGCQVMISLSRHLNELICFCVFRGQGVNRACKDCKDKREP